VKFGLVKDVLYVRA